MTGYDRGTKALAACLSALAGYVDAIGYISLGGFFVSFMSGNTTRVGVGLAEEATTAGAAAGLIGLFVLGVVLGASVGRRAGAHRRPAVLALVCALLALAALAAGLGAGPLAAAGMVLAMGAENAVLAEDGEVRIGVTYMTGTLVKLGKRITAALFGGDRLAWAPYLLLWLGLLAGSVAGALAYHRLGLAALWAAAALAGTAAWIGPEADRSRPG